LTSELEVLELLEERVQRATELIRGLRKENLELKALVKDAEARLLNSQETISKLEEVGRRGDEVTRQLKLLQEERQEIRGRVTRMLETFAAMEEIPSSGHADN
jgi:FtsZ-binding cell division protein ZapB